MRFAYISRAADCNCMAAISVDDPKYKKETARFVSEQIKAGLRVERIELNKPLKEIDVCETHPENRYIVAHRKKKKAELFK